MFFYDFILLTYVHIVNIILSMYVWVLGVHVSAYPK